MNSPNVFLTRRALQLVLVGGACALGGCASYSLQTPPGFVVVEPAGEGYAYRATTADGVVLALREVTDEPENAQLDFWVRAVENELAARGGYALLEVRDVTTATGQPGKQLEFGLDQGETPYQYRVVLFMGESEQLYVLEVGGPREQMEKEAPRLQAAISSFRGD